MRRKYESDDKGGGEGPSGSGDMGKRGRGRRSTNLTGSREKGSQQQHGSQHHGAGPSGNSLCSSPLMSLSQQTVDYYLPANVMFATEVSHSMTLSMYLTQRSFLTALK
jgi:hypothetical protein